MSAAKYVLRDLPGVAELEARLKRISQHPHPGWAPEADNLHEDIDAMVLRLFGVSEDDLMGGSAKPVTEEDLAPVKDGFAAAGWDTTDGNGNELLMMEYVGMTLMLVAAGVVGHTPDKPSDRELMPQEAESIEARLRAEAAKFRGKR